MDVAIKFDLTLKEALTVPASTISSIQNGLASNSQSVSQKRSLENDKPDYLKDIVISTTAKNGVQTTFQKENVQVNNFPLITDPLAGQKVQSSSPSIAQ